MIATLLTQIVEPIIICNAYCFCFSVNIWVCLKSKHNGNFILMYDLSTALTGKFQMCRAESLIINKILIHRHFLGYLDILFRYMNTSEISISTNYSNIIITAVQHQNFIIWWTADVFFIFSKFLKIEAVLHLITSVEIDVNFDIRNFDVFQNSN